MKIAKIFLIASILFVLSQSTVWAADATSTCHILEVPLGTFTQACGPAEYLTKIYTISVGVAVALAVVMIVYAGIIYITSGDNASKQKEAKSQITQAIFGLALLLASYLILRTVNPDLTDLGKWQNLPSQQVPEETSSPTNEDCQAQTRTINKCVVDTCYDASLSSRGQVYCLFNCCKQFRSPECGNCKVPGTF